MSGYIATPGGRNLNEPMTQGYQRLPEPKPKRFAMNYHLLAIPPRQAPPPPDAGARVFSGMVVRAVPPDSPPRGTPGRETTRRVRVQVWLDDGEPISSVVPVWPTADWHEREAWDLMGIRAEGHPNLSRILMEDDWEGHPLRKDYPIGGEPVRFSGEE